MHQDNVHATNCLLHSGTGRIYQILVLYEVTCGFSGNVPPPHVQVHHCMWSVLPALVLQATNAGVRRPGHEANTVLHLVYGPCLGMRLIQCVYGPCCRATANTCSNFRLYLFWSSLIRRKLALLVVMSPFLQIASIPQISKYNILLYKKLNCQSLWVHH